jgi:flagellar hook protein FlgE
MFQALFNSLSGLFSFSKSLNTVSNNVANMNTPGFRGSDSFLENINGGGGSRVAGEGLRTQAGASRVTGSPTDLLVDGTGFFILRDDKGNLFYTRAGQFKFNDQGVLEDPVTHYEVMAIDSAGNLTTIDMDNYRTLPAKPTTAINMAGNIIPNTSPDPMTNVKVYDAAGVLHTLTITLTDNHTATAGSYLVSVTDGSALPVSGGAVGTPVNQIRFSTDGLGTPISGANTLTVKVGTGAAAQNITLNFGTPGATSGTTNISAGSQLASVGAQVVDGHAALAILTDKSYFDDMGVFHAVYLGNEKQTGPRVALASFANESNLQMIGGRLVSGSSASPREIGRPGEGVFGTITGGSLEGANVDLTQEFADMIIIQRGYQASSKVMNISNQMIEELYNSTRGG